MPEITSKTGIANLALSMIGAGPIGDLGLEDDTTAQARVCRKWFDTAMNESLGAHPWNFAMQRRRLLPDWRSLDPMTGTARAVHGNGSGGIRVEAGLHELEPGQRIYVRGVQGVPGANGTWYVQLQGADAFDLRGSTYPQMPNGSGGTTDLMPSPHVNGTGEWVSAPLFDWDYEFLLPGDCLRVCNVNGREGGEEDSTPYVIEGRKILSNDQELNLLYVRKMSNDPSKEWKEITLWPDDFKTAFALLLGSYIAQELMGPAGKSAELRQQYESVVSPKVRGRDARQGKGRRIPLSHDSDVVRARAGAGMLA